MVAVERGQIWWADLGPPIGSSPGYRRPVLIVQSDAFNRSRISTVIGVVITSNITHAGMPGNVMLPRRISGLERDSVANVSQVVTVDRSQLSARAGQVPARELSMVSQGLRLILAI